MVKFLIVPAKDWDTVKKFLGAADEGVVLLPEPTLKKMPSDVQEVLTGLNDTELDHYDFGNEPDVAVDIITVPDHFAVSRLTGADNT